MHQRNCGQNSVRELNERINHSGGDAIRWRPPTPHNLPTASHAISSGLGSASQPHCPRSAWFGQGFLCVAIVAARGGVAQPAEPGLAAFCELRPRYQKTQGLTRSDQKASSEKN